MTRFALLAALLFALPAHAFDITACGQTVPPNETGILQVDLDCSALPPDACVRVSHRSTLDLNGHSILGRPDSTMISCAGARLCTVIGPGDLSGGEVAIYGGKHLTVTDVTIHDTLYGIHAPTGTLRLTDVSVDNSQIGGIQGNKVLATNVSATQCGGAGISAFGSMRATGVIASDNDGPGVHVVRGFDIDGLTAMNNGQAVFREGAGLYAVRRGRLSNATLSGNSYSSPFLPTIDVDVFARRPVRISNVTCDHSREWITIEELGGTWGYCSLD